MPETRQESPTTPPTMVTTLRAAGWLPQGRRIGTHFHAEAQLMYPASGAVATTTDHGTWIAAANRVIWTPPGFAHSHQFYGRTDIRLIGIPAELCGAVAAQPAMFVVTPLLREALLALSARREIRPDSYTHLSAVVLDELVEPSEQSLCLPEPQDDRLRAVTAALHADPAQNTTLGELGRAAGASERTLSRLFHREFGMSFHRWRTALRIHHALTHLANGESVTDTAIVCGWSNPSSFIDAFTSVVGQTPGRYRAAGVALR
ncbi:helix-turn-helix transcriptional regulator [soil metagenome]